MTMSVIFCLTYGLSKELLLPFELTKLYSNEKCIVVTDVVMTLLVAAESVNTRVVIIIRLGLWLSPAVSTRDPIIKTESDSSRADNGRGLILKGYDQSPML